MIESTADAGSLGRNEPPQARVRISQNPLWLTAFGTIAVTLLLQLWRPFFHLTDDNLSAYLPSVVEFGQKLWSGRWPFVADGSFGGNHNLLADPGVFGLLSPWMFAWSWLALTPFDYLIVDLVSLCNSLAIALAFCWSSMWLRDHFELATPNWLIVVLSLSYTFTPYNLLVGSSWIGFLNAQAGLPLIFVGCFHRSHRPAILLQTGALLYALFGGHAHIFVYLSLFAGVFAFGAAIQLRSMAPLWRIGTAAMLATVIASPVLFATMQGFAGSARAEGVAVADASARRMEAPILFATLVLGPLGTLAAYLFGKYNDQAASTLSLGYSAVNLLWLMLLIRFRARTRGSNLILCGLAVAALFVVRPGWLGAIVGVIPLLKSLQWPFRETWIILFAIHLYVLFNWSIVSRNALRTLMALGTVIMLGVVASPAPSFYEFALDRRLVLNGAAKAYWARLVRENGHAPQVLVAIDPGLMDDGRDEIPFSLLGTYSFGSMYGFTSMSGYTFTSALRSDEGAAMPRPYYFSGTFTPADARTLARRYPNAWVITLERIRPAEWNIRNGAGVRRFRLDARNDQISELSATTR